jgi:protein-tyrosine phosphatase
MPRNDRFRTADETPRVLRSEGSNGDAEHLDPRSSSTSRHENLSELPPSVLFVCTANLCRSPLAEGLAGTGPFAHLGWRAGSAGSRARPGLPVHPLAAAALAARGVTLAGFASRPLAHVDVAAADLVLVAAPEHRRAVLGAAPGAGGRTFLLRQFARLAGVVPPAPAGRGVAELVEAVRAARQQVTPWDAERDVLADPIGGDAATFELTAALVADDLAAIARAALAAPVG